MKINLRKSLIKITTAILVVSFFLPLLATKTEAASLTAMSDTMTRLKTSTLSDHVVKFTTPTGVAAAGTITIDFNTSSFSTGSTAFGDVDFTHGASTGLETSETLAATCSGTTWGAAFAANVLTITSCTGTVTAADKVIITIGLSAAGGANQITNPGSSGSKKIPLTAGASDSGTLAVPILSDDQVAVSATVDPTITSTLSANTCALGTLSSGAVAFCSYTNTVSTNASSGYVSSIYDTSSSSAGKLCSPSVGTCTNDINVAAGDNDIDQGSEEYGVGTSKAGQTITQYTTCANNNPQPAKAISTATQQYANAAAPVSADVTTLCHAASITGSTPAGSYTGTVTHVTTGTF